MPDLVLPIMMGASLISLLFMVVYSGYTLYKKIKVQHQLIVKLAKNQAFLREAAKLTGDRSNDEKYGIEINFLHKTIADSLDKEFKADEAKLMTEPLSQPSRIGRQRFIEGIARAVQNKAKHATT